MARLEKDPDEPEYYGCWVNACSSSDVFSPCYAYTRLFCQQPPHHISHTRTSNQPYRESTREEAVVRKDIKPE